MKKTYQAGMDLSIVGEENIEHSLMIGAPRREHVNSEISSNAPSIFGTGSGKRTQQNKYINIK